MDQDAGGQLVFEDDLGLVVDAVSLVSRSRLDDVLGRLLPWWELALGAVLVGDGLGYLDPA